MADQVFAEGIYFNLPRRGAPTFVVGSLSLNVDKVIQFLQQHRKDDGYVNCDIKLGRNGNPYVSLDTYVRGQAQRSNTQQTKQDDWSSSTTDGVDYPTDEIDPDSISF